MPSQWSHLYKTARWRNARAFVLAREPLCRMCLELGRTVPATVVDHIKAHKGDLDLFNDLDNLQPLCKPCHDRHAQRRDRGRATVAFGVDGRPVGVK